VGPNTLPRFAEVEDVVECIVFLLGPGAALVSGVTLPVDGGFLAT
jgi:NAD(P)-dependent dehydrogenase (short-subunit alcohol dehydrogenase family)